VDFFLPQAYPLIDFTKKPEFLEQELHKLVHDGKIKGKKINDKLIKVYLKDGSDQRILLHIEVQSDEKKEFLKRMFIYFYRIYDRYREKLTALAIYTGNYVPERYDRFVYSFLGTEITYKFNTYLVKTANETKLLQSKNPFALAVLATKYLNATKNDAEKRLLFKLKLIRLALERNYSKKKNCFFIEIYQLFVVVTGRI